MFVVQGRLEQPDRRVPSSQDPKARQGRLFRNDGVSDGRVGFTDVTARATSRCTDTRWARPRPISTTTAASTSTSQRSGGTSCSATAAAARLPTSRSAPVWTRPDGRSPHPSWTTTATAGWICTWPTTSTTRCRHASSATPPAAGRTTVRRRPSGRSQAACTGTQRNGTFVDVSATALVGGHFGPALGVATADFDNDGWVDIYVANDGEANQLWLNQHDGTFKDKALLAGAALSAEGAAEGSMGVDAGDFDNDGDEDLFITELTGQGVRPVCQRRHGGVHRRERARRPPVSDTAIHRIRDRAGSTTTTMGCSTWRR